LSEIIPIFKELERNIKEPEETNLRLQTMLGRRHEWLNRSDYEILEKNVDPSHVIGQIDQLIQFGVLLDLDIKHKDKWNLLDR
jgi:hypothetical protein